MDAPGAAASGGGTVQDPCIGRGGLADSLSLRIAYELLASFADAPRNAGEPPPLTGAEIARLIDFIEAEMEANFDLTAMASVLDRDQFGFSRSFRAATGESPHQCVIQRRLMRAKQQLADCDDSLADIAYATGFASQSHMTATFSKHVGCPPGAYRKGLRTRPPM
ncbi:MAG: AraC family transcriptional regulator [Pseudomonadota bacterium]